MATLTRPPVRISPCRRFRRRSASANGASRPPHQRTSSHRGHALGELAHFGRARRSCSSGCRWHHSSNFAVLLQVEGSGSLQEVVRQVVRLVIATTANASAAGETRGSHAGNSDRRLAPAPPLGSRPWIRLRSRRAESSGGLRARKGSITNAANVRRSSAFSAARHNVVLPVPTSPISARMPSRRRMPATASKRHHALNGCRETGDPRTG